MAQSCRPLENNGGPRRRIRRFGSSQIDVERGETHLKICVATVPRIARERQVPGSAHSALQPGRPCQSLMHFRRANAKTPAFRAGVSGLGSLTITYFHTGIRTIIGVESFHG
ncbi:hypothetical protein, partial [Burkholderia sp. Ac-20384]|uniref:hypothetical protein n=1 Tax=Burkholderia sp. Ac-20384 TaxID=2703902 RepID=UPI00197EDB43